MTGWGDVPDRGRPDLRRAWRLAPDDPPALEVVADVDVPAGWVALERDVPL